MEDITAICAFCDFWMGGYGVAEGIPGAGNDYFVPKARQEKYLNKYDVRIATMADCVVGWAVMGKNNCLIHLLVNPTLRRCNIGKTLVKQLSPSSIRLKTDQKAGNPIVFYEKLGYEPKGPKLTGKKKNIQLLFPKDAHILR